MLIKYLKNLFGNKDMQEKLKFGFTAFMARSGLNDDDGKDDGDKINCIYNVDNINDIKDTNDNDNIGI